MAGCGFGGGCVCLSLDAAVKKKRMIHDGHHFKAGVMVIIVIKWESTAGAEQC